MEKNAKPKVLEILTNHKNQFLPPRPLLKPQ